MIHDKDRFTLNNIRDYPKTTCGLTINDNSYKKQQQQWNLTRIKSFCQSLNERFSQTDNIMKKSGFKHTDNPVIIRCEDCKYEISNWTSDMDLLKIHTTMQPNCPFVCRVKSSTLLTTTSQSALPLPISTGLPKTITLLEGNESPSKRQKVEADNNNISVIRLSEANIVQQIRKRTFSHWPSRHTVSAAQMVEAGFFHCNVGDRVICIYCNLICQEWTSNTEDPCEVHKTLSPNCVYVKSKLIRRDFGPLMIVNESVAGASTATAEVEACTSSDQYRCNEFVHTAACHSAFIELPKRANSFVNWNEENMPSVDSLVRAGFFYTGVNTVVTCFYCNGSLQNWGPKDNPTIEHARWFPQCAYARQLCGDELYRKIQESKRAQQERIRMNEAKNNAQSSANSNTTSSSSTPNPNSRMLHIPDESTLSRLVAARLDLPVSQSLLGEFKLSIIKRCWEDQLRLKLDDFVSDCDLRMACTILQRQITVIDGKKENIIVPHVRMRKIREDAERARTEASLRERANAEQKTPSAENSAETMTTPSSDNNVEMTTPELPTSASKANSEKEQKAPKPAASNAGQRKEKDDTPLANVCVVCMEEEKRLACIPCGHFVACVPCGHSLRCCPICRREVDAFVRIFI
ncbi:unnamed protein product [Adineta ricciae]|uniref:RING-type domain-containing protein n=1 Tax=Adineta ricciae TaxID=249248 RepID=A0A815YY35_ADIRI|nr:unnamed protein product [Adineta ricciae]CAF1576759.1 unnamed protein product [Adineta ricciae]